jgi:hypothetical protein
MAPFAPHRLIDMLLHPRLVWLVTAATLCLSTLATAGCGGGRVPKEFQPKQALATWSDAEWAGVLDDVATEDGFVRWQKLKDNEDGVRDRLFRYVGQLGAASPRSDPNLFETDEEKLSYYINAYNALAMYGIVKRGYPGNVLRPTGVDPGALFFLDKFYVGGKWYTLNGLEREEVLDRSGRDARMHYAVNCMSFSCPPLLDEPFAGEKLEEQLDRQGAYYLSDSRAVKRLDDGETVGLNNIFVDWYRSDFAPETNGDEELLATLKEHAAEGSPVLTATRVKDIGYDWSLNAPPEE